MPIVEKLRGPAESFIVVYVLDSFVEPCFILRSLHQVHRGLYKVVCFCLGGLGGGTFGKCRCMEVSTSCEHSGCIFVAVAWGSCACAAGYGRAIVDGMAEKGKGGKCHAAPSLHGCSAQKLVRTQHILGCFGHLRVLLSSGVSPTETSEDNACKQFLVNITSITPPNRPFTRLPIVLLRLPHNTHGRPPTLVHRFDRLGTADRPPANLSLAPVGPTSTDWLGEGT